MATTVAGRTALALWIAAFSIDAAAVDSWDAAAVKDNSAATTRNELSRGEWQEHDLEAVGGVADDDWFVVPVTPFRTYQLVVNQITGDTPIDNADFLTLFRADGTTQVAQATGGPNATAKVIRWYTEDQTSFRLRVRGTSGLTSGAKYMVQYVESTLYCPRYNNTGPQATVVIIQNVTNSACSGVFVNFFTENGAFLSSAEIVVPAAGTSVVPASSVTNVQGTKGSVQINHFCSPSAFKAKAVALEQSTGYSFDTLCERR